jgi:hypothetical protein
MGAVTMSWKGNAFCPSVARASRNGGGGLQLLVSNVASMHKSPLPCLPHAQLHGRPVQAAAGSAKAVADGAVGARPTARGHVKNDHGAI